MKSLLSWLKLWTDETCPQCQKAIKASKDQKGGESLQLKLTIIKDIELCPVVHAEVIE